MKTQNVSRAVVAVASILFAGIALAIWILPDEAARLLGLELVRPAGAAVMRADLGGLFAGMALLCAMAAYTAQASWCFAASAVLAAIIVGRVLGWLSAGRIGGDVAELLVEVLCTVALLALARSVAPAAIAAPKRRSWRPSALLTVLAIVPIAGATALVSPRVQQRIFDVAAGKRAAAVNTAILQDDAMRVAVCGSSAPLPSKARAKACIAVFAGGKFYIVDVGPESVENLMTWGIPMLEIGGVLLTHFHSDHVGDLGELNLQTWAAGRRTTLPVYGGPGVDRVVNGFNEAYRLDQGYRTAHHGEKVMPPPSWPMVPQVVDVVASPSGGNRRAVVLQDRGLTITAFEVDHTPISPAYAYRFDYKGRSVFVTGDLKFQPSLVQAVRGADVLISEAIAVRMTRALGKGAGDAGRDQAAAIMHDIEDYHMTPEQAASIANEAQVKLLVFYHLLPAPDGPLARSVFANGISEARRGDWTIADDGSLYTLPLGTADVRIRTVLE